MFTFPKKLPPRHKKKRKKKYSPDVAGDDDVMKEKPNNCEEVDKKVSSIGFGKDVRGKVYLLNKYVHGISDQCYSKCGPRPLLPTSSYWSVTEYELTLRVNVEKLKKNF